jgi:hypothetical protein
MFHVKRAKMSGSLERPIPAMALTNRQWIRRRSSSDASRETRDTT